MGSNFIFPFCVGACVFLDHEDKLNPAPADGQGSMAERILKQAKPSIFVSIPGSIQTLSERLMEGASAQGELVEALRGCKVLTSAGAPLPPSTFLNFVYAAKTVGCTGCQALDGIGTSELQHIFISNHVNDIKSGEGSVGRVCVGYDAKLLNPQHQDDGWQGELMVRTHLKDIMAHYSSEHQPMGADYEAATREVVVPDDDGGAPWYVTGDIARAKHDPATGKYWFYLLGRTKDLASQINDGAARGMGVDDFENKRIADQILLTAGMYETRAKVAQAVRTGSANDVLVTGAYPIKVLYNGQEPIIFVCAVSTEHYGSAATDDNFKAWAEYIDKETAGQAKGLVTFVRSSDLPRTPPPLLKPKVNVIKKSVQAWVDKTQPQALGAQECLQMSKELVFE